MIWLKTENSPVNLGRLSRFGNEKLRPLPLKGSLLPDHPARDANSPSGHNLGFSDFREFKCLCMHRQLYGLFNAAGIERDGVTMGTKKPHRILPKLKSESTVGLPALFHLLRGGF